ncbi:MAG: hypothetical protein ABSF72_05785 [Candidatus Sulfotelmatobacter sp.]|jgi:hypothetical protein
MILALILGLCLWNTAWLPPALGGSTPQAAAQPPATASSDSSQNQDNSPSQAQTPSSQSAQPAQAPNSPPNSPAQAKPAPARPRRKKTIPPNCSNAPTALNTTVGMPGDPANSTGAATTTSGSNTAGPLGTDAKNANAAPLKPCPPPKKVVRNGGSSEPKVQLTGGTAAEQASDKSSTNQLRAATEENLKKATGLQLNPSQREMVNQIREFMAQSKAAVAAGDLEGAHNLALKAHLLSEELVKP